MVMDYNGESKATYSFVLLVSFLIGATLYMMYSNRFQLPILKTGEAITVAYAIFFVLSALMVSCITGIVVQPILMIGFGACTSYRILECRLEYVFADIDWCCVIISMLIVPAYYFLCDLGMKTSSRIRETISVKKKFYRKTLFVSYTVVFITAVSVLLLVRYIMNI